MIYFFSLWLYAALVDPQTFTCVRMEYVLTSEMSPMTHSILSLSMDLPLRFMWTSHVCADEFMWPSCSLLLPCRHCPPTHSSPPPSTTSLPLILSISDPITSSSLMFKFHTKYTQIAHLLTSNNNAHCTLLPCSFVINNPAFPLSFPFPLKNALLSFLFHIANGPSQIPSMPWPCAYSCAPWDNTPYLSKLNINLSFDYIAVQDCHQQCIFPSFIPSLLTNHP